MKDVLMLLVIAVFFALCIAYVSWCDRIIGPDPADVRDDFRTDLADAEQVHDEVHGLEKEQV